VVSLSKETLNDRRALVEELKQNDTFSLSYGISR